MAPAHPEQSQFSKPPPCQPRSFALPAAGEPESEGSNMSEQTPKPEYEETEDEKPEAHDAAAGSPAEQAKKREREMEESGEENAA